MDVSPAPRILCVDDDADSGELIKMMLRLADERYAVTAILSSSEALTLINEESFDLYILDYALPYVSGVELCQRIRESASETPVIFFSGMARETDRAAAFAAGATAYLLKPDDLERLTPTIAQLLSDASQSKSNNREAAQSDCRPANVSHR